MEAETKQAEFEYEQFDQAVKRNDTYVKDLARQVDELARDVARAKIPRARAYEKVRSLESERQVKEKELEQMALERSRALLSTAKSRLETQEKNRILHWYADIWYWLVALAVVSILTGLFMSLVGFKLWYSRLQLYQDIAVKQDGSVKPDPAAAAENTAPQPQKVG